MFKVELLWVSLKKYQQLCHYNIQNIYTTMRLSSQTSHQSVEIVFLNPQKTQAYLRFLITQPQLSHQDTISLFEGPHLIAHATLSFLKEK